MNYIWSRTFDKARNKFSMTNFKIDQSAAFQEGTWCTLPPVATLSSSQDYIGKGQKILKISDQHCQYIHFSNIYVYHEDMDGILRLRFFTKGIKWNRLRKILM